MADFGGFQVKTPQEVLANLQQQRMAIAQIGDPRARRNANIQFQMANLFGSSELRKARALEDRMRTVNKEVQANPTRDSLTGEKRRLSLMYDAVKELDPLAASQIQSRLVELDQEIFERQRLQAADRRAERNTRINEQNAAINQSRENRAAQFDDFAYTADQNGNVTAYDLTNPARNRAFGEAMQTGNSINLTQAQAAQMLGRANVKNAMANELVNNSGFEKVVNRYRADAEFMDKTTKLLSILARDAGAATNVNDVAKITAGLAEEGRAAVRVMQADDGSGFNLGLTKEYISNRLDQIEDLTLPAGTNRAQFESMILNMGYVLARSLDSGGRLSDQDVNMAIEMLTGGSVNAKTITSILLQNAVGKVDMLDGADAVLFSQDAADAGNPQARVVRQLSSQVRRSYNPLLEQAARILDEQEMWQVMKPTITPAITSTVRPTGDSPTEESILMEGIRKHMPRTHAIAERFFGEEEDEEEEEGTRTVSQQFRN